MRLLVGIYYVWRHKSALFYVGPRSLARKEIIVEGIQSNYNVHLMSLWGFVMILLFLIHLVEESKYDISQVGK